MNLQNYIVKYLDEVQLMQLATCSHEQPWICSVYFAMDNQHNLYWLSQNTRRHSRDIYDNPQVAATIVLPYAVGQPGRAVQVEGQARAVSQDEIENFFQAYAERFTKHALLPKLLDDGNSLTLYQLCPKSFVLYDEANFPDDPRQEWDPVQ